MNLDNIVIPDQETLTSLLRVIGFDSIKVWRLENGYYPCSSHDSDEDILRTAVYRARRPWWLAQTQFGLLEMGPRKRVLHIEWDFGNFPDLTEDDVTKSDTMVHAYSITKAISYLGALYRRVDNPSKEKPCLRA